jgi:rRNA-processing protein FCF1
MENVKSESDSGTILKPQPQEEIEDGEIVQALSQLSEDKMGEGSSGSLSPLGNQMPPPIEIPRTSPQHNIQYNAVGHIRMREDSAPEDEPDPKRRKVEEPLRSRYSSDTAHPNGTPRSAGISHDQIHSVSRSNTNSPTKYYNRPYDARPSDTPKANRPSLGSTSESHEFVPFIKPCADLIILDTNWIIRYYDYLYALLLPQTKGVHIVIPNQITVELEKLKLRARPEEKLKFQRAFKWFKKFLVITKDIKRVHFYKSKKNVDNADEEIIEAALHFKKYTSNVTVLTEDNTLIIRLVAEDVKVAAAFVLRVALKYADGETKYFSSEKELNNQDFAP